MARPSTYNLTINLFEVSYVGTSYVLTPKNWDGTTSLIVVGGLDLTPILPTSNSIVVSPALTQIYEQQNLQLSVNSTGFKSYSNNIGVFGYDKVLNIYLLPDDADFTYARYNRVDSPYNSDIYFYNAVGNAGNVTYTIADSDTVINSPNIVYNSQDRFDIEMLASINDGVTSYSNTYIGTELGNPLTKWYPTYSVGVTTPLLDPSCTYLGATNSIYAYADFGGLLTFNINGIASVFPHTITILQELIDIDNMIVDDRTTIVNAITPPVAYTATPWNPTIPTYGYYTIRTTYTISDKDGTDIHTCILKNVLKTQYWLDIERADCDNIMFTNLSDSDATLTVDILEEVNNVKQWTDIDELDTVIASGESTILELKGVYKVTVVHDAPVETVEFVIVNYCYLQACLETVINNVMCGNMNMESLRKILPVMYLHMSELHNEYVNNYYYEFPMPNSKIQELWTIKESAERLELYCEDCTDYKNGCGC